MVKRKKSLKQINNFKGLMAKDMGFISDSSCIKCDYVSGNNISSLNLISIKRG